MGATMNVYRRTGRTLRWGAAIAAAIVLATGAGIAPSSAATASPTGNMDCGINGKITVSPRLQSAAAGGVSQVHVTATLTDCNGPFGYAGEPTGPAIHSGLLTVAGTGTLDPAGPATDCNTAVLVWQPTSAWQIVWKAGPNGTGAELGRSVIRGMTLATYYLPTYYNPHLLAMGIFNWYGETDAVTNGPASWTGAFGNQGALLIGFSGNVPIVADPDLCGTASGVKTFTFSGPTGDPRSDPPPSAAVRIDL